MAELKPLLQEMRGIVSDVARDRLPEGSVWNAVDLVPTILQAAARQRGRWLYASNALPNPPDGMIFAPFEAGSRLLVANGADLRVIPIPTVGSTSIGSIPPTRQSPVYHRDRVIIPAADGATAARYVTFNGTVYTLTNAPASALTGRYACVWKDRLVLGNTAAEPQQIAWSKPGDPTIAWDSISIANTSYELTGLAAQTTQVLAFHASSVERLRGTTPPDSTLTDPTGDLIMDTLWNKAGCYDARSIAEWSQNILFADERGIHLTDGAFVRNVVRQGGFFNLWRDSFERNGSPPLSIAAGVHQDFYVVTIRHTGLPPITLVVDIPTRRAFKVSNVDSAAYAFSISTGERLYGTDHAANRVVDLTYMFDPDNTVLQVDDDGTAVLPVIETGVQREGGFRRIRELHVSYLADADADPDVIRASYVGTPEDMTPAVLGELKKAVEFRRNKIDVGHRLPGFGVKLEQLVATRDTRLYDMSLRVDAEEGNRL